MKKNRYLALYLKVFILLVLMLFIIVNFVYPVYYHRYVSKYSKEYNVDEYLVYSVIKAESGHNKDAVSPKGAVGLMQIMDTTATDIMERIGMNEDIESLSDPEVNIRVGTYYLRYLLERYEGEVDMAIAAYNAGMSNADRWKAESSGDDFANNIDIKETNEYVKRVNQNYQVYEFLFGNLNLYFLSLPDLFANIKVFGTNILRYLKGWVMSLIEKV